MLIINIKKDALSPSRVSASKRTNQKKDYNFLIELIIAKSETPQINVAIAGSGP